MLVMNDDGLFTHCQHGSFWPHATGPEGCVPYSCLLLKLEITPRWRDQTLRLDGHQHPGGACRVCTASTTCIPGSPLSSHLRLGSDPWGPWGWPIPPGKGALERANKSEAASKCRLEVKDKEPHVSGNGSTGDITNEDMKLGQGHISATPSRPASQASSSHSFGLSSTVAAPSQLGPTSGGRFRVDFPFAQTTSKRQRK